MKAYFVRVGVGLAMATALPFACATGSETSTEEGTGASGAGASGGSSSGCPDGLSSCNGACVDLTRDARHCGECGEACPSDQRCEASACVCSDGDVFCEGSCIDPDIDPQHCGASGTCSGASAGIACPPGQVCNGSGQCAPTCQEGLIDCGGVCIDPLNDEDHCGAGPDCEDNPGVECNNGEICDGAGVCALSCQDELTNCNGLCTDPLIDPQNCETCGNVCPPAANAIPVCAEADCAFVCIDGFADCNLAASDGCEVNLNTDPLNCGTCGTECANCPCDNIVFVTSAMYDGNLGGLTGADAICQTHAANAGFSGTFLAWLSDSTGSPDTRFTHSTTPYVRPDGVQIAANWADLTDGTLAAPINVTENLTTAPIGTTSCGGGGFATVWSNTTPSGTLAGALHCDNWGNNAGTQAAWGKADMSDSSWTGWCTGGGAVCVWVSPIYCFEQ
jgi:hypothetical protein